jgi:hypothetical protein
MTGLEDRVARLEHQVDLELVTKSDLARAQLEISRDIANLAAGIGADLRGLRADIADLRELRADVAAIRQALEHRRPEFRWPWESRA